MTGNPLSGHTKANVGTLSGGVATAVDGLIDGSHIISPSLTNIYEGVHGNGILLLEDTATGEGTRNQPENLPGMCDPKTNTYTVEVTGGNVVIDGAVYSFAGGYDGSGNPSSDDVDFTTSSVHKTGSPSALSSGQEALIVVYLSTDGDAANNVYWEMGSAVTTGANVYPVCPSAFLNYPSGSLSSKQSVVLAVIRVVYNGSGGGGDLKISITEVNDKRVFLKPSPVYFTPVTTGAVGATTAVDTHIKLDNIYGTGVEQGDFTGTKLGGLWQSFGGQIGSTVAGDNAKDVLYYSATHAVRYTRSVFDRVLTSTATSIDLTAADANILVLTPGGTFAITTDGCFPAGYVIEIKNLHGTNTGTFALTNSTTAAIGDTADADGGYARFVCITSHASDPTFVRLI